MQNCNPSSLSCTSQPQRHKVRWESTVFILRNILSERKKNISSPTQAKQWRNPEFLSVNYRWISWVYACIWGLSIFRMFSNYLAIYARSLTIVGVTCHRLFSITSFRIESQKVFWAQKNTRYMHKWKGLYLASIIYQCLLIGVSPELIPAVAHCRTCRRSSQPKHHISQIEVSWHTMSW